MTGFRPLRCYGLGYSITMSAIYAKLSKAKDLLLQKSVSLILTNPKRANPNPNPNPSPPTRSHRFSFHDKIHPFLPSTYENSR